MDFDLDAYGIVIRVLRYILITFVLEQQEKIGIEESFDQSIFFSKFISLSEKQVPNNHSEFAQEGINI